MAPQRRQPEQTTATHNAEDGRLKTMPTMKSRRLLAVKQRSTSQAHSLLLSLPAEIRNAVYENFMASSPDALVSSRKRGILSSRSPLILASKQVHDEYQAIIWKQAPRITATVKDFDFQHVVTFLNRLQDSQLDRRPSGSSKSKRTITVELRLTPKYNGDKDLLRRWLRRFERSTKACSAVDICYVYASEATPSDAVAAVTPLIGQPGPWLWLGPSDGWIRTWQSGYLERLWQDTEDERKKIEIGRIVQALRHPVSVGSSSQGC